MEQDYGPEDHLELGLLCLMAPVELSNQSTWPSAQEVDDMESILTESVSLIHSAVFVDAIEHKRDGTQSGIEVERSPLAREEVQNQRTCNGEDRSEALEKLYDTPRRPVLTISWMGSSYFPGLLRFEVFGGIVATRGDHLNWNINDRLNGLNYTYGSSCHRKEFFLVIDGACECSGRVGGGGCGDDFISTGAFALDPDFFSGHNSKRHEAAGIEPYIYNTRSDSELSFNMANRGYDVVVDVDAEVCATRSSYCNQC